MPNNKDKEKQKKEKKFYTVEVECLIPAVVKYRVLVDEDEYDLAIKESIRVMPMSPPKLNISRMKRISAKVYDWGTNMMRHVKRY